MPAAGSKMPAMRFSILGGALVLVFAAACGSKVVDRLEEFADQACSCTDAACAQQVQAEFKAWASENESARGSEKHRKRAEKAMKRYAECVDKLVVGTPQPTATPDGSAEPPAQPAAPPAQPADPPAEAEAQEPAQGAGAAAP